MQKVWEPLLYKILIPPILADTARLELHMLLQLPQTPGYTTL